MDDQFFKNLKNFTDYSLINIRIKDSEEEQNSRALDDIIDKMISLNKFLRSGHSSWKEINELIRNLGQNIEKIQREVGMFFTTFCEIMKQIGGFSRNRAFKILIE
jgi:hypothetical protein